MTVLVRRAPRDRWRRSARSIATVLALLLTTTMMGCGCKAGGGPSTFEEVPADAPDVENPPSEGPGDVENPPSEGPGDVGRAALSLRGDPTFDSNDLSLEQRTTYDAIKRLIAAPPDGQFNSYVMANRDDIWWYGHGLQTHVQAVLIAFRITGDLSLLDHIDELGELMRAKLRDSWRGTKDGSDGTSDGYLNWVHRTVTTEEDHGKDIRLEYDQKAHATAATIAYALHNNRDLTSPKGYDYGEHADFWKDYLVNHFEAKVRSRHGTTDGSFPIVDWPPQINSYSSWTKWHHYMGLLTGNASYTTEAERMSDALLDQLVPCGTAHGDAYVFRRNDPEHPTAGSYGQYLSATTYAEFVFADAVEFHLEGFHSWADPVHLERYARTMTQYIMDNDDPINDGLARTVGGERDRCGVVYRKGSFRRINAHLFSRMTLALLAPWDPTNAITALATDMHTHNAAHDRDTSRILAGLMLNTHLHSDPSATTRTTR